MHKKSLFLFAMIFAALLCVTAAYAEAAYIMDFNDTISLPIMGFKDCNLTYEQDHILITSLNGPENGGGGDVYINHGVSIPDADAAQWMKIRLKNNSSAPTFEMHFASTASGDIITGATCTHFPVTTFDSDYKEYVFNIKDYNLQKMRQGTPAAEKSLWEGAVNQLRLDPMYVDGPGGKTPTGSEMQIDYVAFFATEQEANDYVHTEKTISQEALNVDYSNGVTFIFDNAETIASWQLVQAQAELSMGKCAFRPLTEDPRYIYTFPQPINAAEYKYFAIYFKADTIAKTATYYASTTTSPNHAEDGFNFFPIVSGKWRGEIVEMYRHKYWDGAVNNFRLDIINSLDLDADILIDRIGFFKTREEAEAFIADAAIVPVDYSKDMNIKRTLQTVIIPGGTVDKDYVASEYVLSDVTLPEGDAVVKFVDKDGKESTVALSYTNSIGHTTFVSRKPGTYTLTSNRKAYSDTAGHWGEEYINFVSDRALFGGTSPTEFSPDMTMTRGMFITVLGRMHGVDTAKYDGNTGYSDVNSGEYYAPYIQWAKENAVMAGVSDTAFAPEEAISREVLAKVINNYVKAFNYTIPTDSVTDFADISEALPENADAIRFVQSLGIINGNTPTTFNPKGISTRAEVATVMQRVIKCILGIPLKYNSDFSKDHIMIGAWSAFPKAVDEELIKTYADAGLNLIVGTAEFDAYDQRVKTLELADKYGIQVMFHNYHARLYQSAPYDDAEFYDHPSFLGHHLRDEPGTDEFETLAKVEDQYHGNYPDKMAFINLLPIGANAAQLKYGARAAQVVYYDPDPDLYKKYVEAYAQQFHSDYMCVDIYPLQAGNKLYNQYCKNLDIFGTVCREYGKDFWIYLQAQTLWGSPNPSEDSFRWQYYTTMSFGAKNFIHYTYGNTSANKEDMAFLGRNGKPTATYFAAQKVNPEILALSDTYVQYKNLGAFALNGTMDTEYLMFDNQYKSDLFTSIKADDSLLIGCFDKKEGEGDAFTLVNMTNFLQTDKKVTVTFSLAKTDAKVTVYSYGKPSVITPKDGAYTVTLDSAQGVFVTVE